MTGIQQPPAILDDPNSKPLHSQPITVSHLVSSFETSLRLERTRATGVTKPGKIAALASFGHHANRLQQKLKKRNERVADRVSDPDYRPYRHVPHRQYGPPAIEIHLQNQAAVEAIETPVCNALYHFDGNSYRMDAFGRAVETRGLLRTHAAQVRGPRDAAIGRSSAVPGDIGFHLGARRFGFVGGKLNVVPGNSFLNGHEYARAEQDLADLADGAGDRKPKRVEACFSAIYNVDSFSIRPAFFEIQYKVGNGKPQYRNFENGFQIGTPTSIPGSDFTPMSRRSSPRLQARRISTAGIPLLTL